MLENKKLLNTVELSLSTIKLPGLLHLQGVTLRLKLLLVLWTEIALFSFVFGSHFLIISRAWSVVIGEGAAMIFVVIVTSY